MFSGDEYIHLHYLHNKNIYLHNEKEIESQRLAFEWVYNLLSFKVHSPGHLPVLVPLYLPDYYHYIYQIITNIFTSTCTTIFPRISYFTSTSTTTFTSIITSTFTSIITTIFTST